MTENITKNMTKNLTEEFEDINFNFNNVFLPKLCCLIQEIGLNNNLDIELLRELNEIWNKNNYDDDNNLTKNFDINEKYGLLAFFKNNYYLNPLRGVLNSENGRLSNIYDYYNKNKNTQQTNLSNIQLARLNSTKEGLKKLYKKFLANFLKNLDKENYFNHYKKIIDSRFKNPQYIGFKDYILDHCRLLHGENDENNDTKSTKIINKYNDFIKIINKTDIHTYDIQVDQMFENIHVFPKFMGYFLMFMIEIKHDFNKKKEEINLTLIKKMITSLVFNYVNTQLKFVSRDDKELFVNFVLNDFNYLNEIVGQEILLNLYDNNGIKCIQQLSNDDIYISSKPDKIATSFPKVLSHGKSVIASLDANNKANIEVANIENLHLLNKQIYPFLYFDAGNQPVLEEETEQGRRDLVLQLSSELTASDYSRIDENFSSYAEDPQDYFYIPTILKKKIYFYALEETRQPLFGVEMRITKDEKPKFFIIFNESFSFPLLRLSNDKQRILVDFIRSINKQKIYFNSVSIPTIIDLYNNVFKYICESFKKVNSIWDQEFVVNYLSKNDISDDLLIYFQNVLVSIVSLKSMGDLIPYYITLLETINNDKSKDSSLQYIGYISSADFSLAQIPLVGFHSTFDDYTFPSLFAGIHIHNCGYIVPLQDEDKLKLNYWGVISNSQINSEFTMIISKFKSNIDIMYSLYYKNFDKLNSQFTDIRLLLGLSFDHIHENDSPSEKQQKRNLKKLIDFHINYSNLTNINDLIKIYIAKTIEIKDSIMPDMKTTFESIDKMGLCDDFLDLCSRYAVFTQQSPINEKENFCEYLLNRIMVILIPYKREIEQYKGIININRNNVDLYVVAEYCVQQKMFGGRPYKYKNFVLKKVKNQKRTYNNKCSDDGKKVNSKKISKNNTRKKIKTILVKK